MTPHVILAGGVWRFKAWIAKLGTLMSGSWSPWKLEVVVDESSLTPSPSSTSVTGFGRWGVDRRIHLESGLEVMDLHDVLEMKLCLNRAKDQADIRTLRSVLNIGAAGCGRCWGSGCSDCGGLGYE